MKQEALDLLKDIAEQLSALAAQARPNATNVHQADLPSYVKYANSLEGINTAINLINEGKIKFS